MGLLSFEVLTLNVLEMSVQNFLKLFNYGAKEVLLGDFAMRPD